MSWICTPGGQHTFFDRYVLPVDHWPYLWAASHSSSRHVFLLWGNYCFISLWQCQFNLLSFLFLEFWIKIYLQKSVNLLPGGIPNRSTDILSSGSLRSISLLVFNTPIFYANSIVFKNILLPCSEGTLHHSYYKFQSVKLSLHSLHFYSSNIMNLHFIHV